MFALLRRYLRRVDALYLALCAACSAVSVVVLVSIGQTQLGSNNKASVQLIASFLGIMLAVIFSTVDYRALARAWPLHATVAWGLVLPTLFLHNFRAGVVTIGYCWPSYWCAAAARRSPSKAADRLGHGGAAGHAVQVEHAQLGQIVAFKIGVAGNGAQGVGACIAKLWGVRLSADAEAIENDQKNTFCHRFVSCLYHKHCVR